MLSIRRSLLSLTMVAGVLTPSIARAQQMPQMAQVAQVAPQPWQDSWFWGAYGGGTSIRTNTGRVTAPTAGAEWFITRSAVALHVFAEQAIFAGSSQLSIAGMASPRLVSIADLRRVGFGVAMLSPAAGSFKPYFELGYSLNLVGSAIDSLRSYATAAQRDSVDSAINTARSTGRLFGSVGAMVLMGQWAPYLQATIMPTKGAGTSLINGDGMGYTVSFGLRYNFGRSSDKIF